MSSTIDKVSQYVTGTVVLPLNPTYAKGCVQLKDWLPDTYTFIGDALQIEAGVDYSLSLLLDGKVPADSSDATRLFHTYSSPKTADCSDGWLSIVDEYFKDDVTPPTGAVLRYTLGLNEDIKAVWPKDSAELSGMTILLLKDGTPVDAGKYAVNLTGLWWVSDSYDDLPMPINYTSDDSSYSLSITKTASAEDQLNGVDISDDSLTDPVEGTTDLSLDILNHGRDTCEASPKTISLFARQTSDVTVYPYDRNGSVLDLNGTNTVPLFTVREDRQSRNLSGKYECTPTDDGGFRVTLNVSRPGVYVAQLMLFDSTGEKLLFVTDYYVSVQPSGAYGGAVSVPEIRYHLMDGCAQKNELIDAFEFSDSDIINAIHSTIEFFNGATGTDVSLRYTSMNFPSDGRYFLKQGVCASLLRSKAVLMLRNQLPYNAGGVSIDDQNKSQEYLQIAQLFDKDWHMYVGRRHSYNSMKRAFISV